MRYFKTIGVSASEFHFMFAWLAQQGSVQILLHFYIKKGSLELHCGSSVTIK